MKKITIITGHYGSGKTNLAVNLALQLADAGEKVTIVDFDIVNPYFRTADFAKLFEERGVTLAASMYANTSLDIPAISFDMERMAYEPGYLIVDVGGDDAGAIGLGRYAEGFSDYAPDQLVCGEPLPLSHGRTRRDPGTDVRDRGGLPDAPHRDREQLQPGKRDHGRHRFAGSAVCGRDRSAGKAAPGLHHLSAGSGRFSRKRTAGGCVCQAGVGGVN